MSRATLALLFTLCLAHGASAVPQCTFKDLMPDYWRVLDAPKDQAVQTFRRLLVDPNGDLYGAPGLGFSSKDRLDAAIAKSIDRAANERDKIVHMSELLRAALPERLQHFRATFADFRCDFTIYLLPSLGTLDGAGRRVNNAGALVFGLDNLTDEFYSSPDGFKLLFDHELFHRYHSQVAGFSDDKAEHEVIWRALWAEGLATYVSQKLNPPATLQDALIVPHDLEARAAPLTSILSRRLEAHLDEVDPKFFAEFFEYHTGASATPARAGYYLGAVYAAKFHRSLYELAHLQDRQVREGLERALKASE